MPELPEVETTLRGIQPHVEHQTIKNIIVRQYNLRWPIPLNIKKHVKNQIIMSVSRRGKYLLVKMVSGCLILHLGMSGSLRVLSQPHRAQKHDHIDMELSNDKILRFTDPRRFGAFLWTKDDAEKHPLLKQLGPEPLSKHLTETYLWQQAQKRKMAVKSFIMNSKIVVGIGNIYATEALFAAQIHPMTRAGEISLARYKTLVTHIKKILRSAIKQGGTTLKDFQHSEGKPGYFKLHLKAYGRANLPCVRCHTALQEIRLGQRSTVYCPRCQK